MSRPVAFVRIVRPVAGSPRVAMELVPMRDYGAEIAAKTLGTNPIRYLIGPQHLRLTTDAPVGYVMESRSFRVEQDLHFFLGPDEPFTGNVSQALRGMEEATDLYWRSWVRGLATPMDWQDAVIRAAITLKLCQHEETGAIVAALTTSIPEAPNSGRNWDYRFCWIRDAYYTVQALNRLGALDVQIGRAHSELQSLMRISYAVFCLKKKKQNQSTHNHIQSSLLLFNTYITFD